MATYIYPNLNFGEAVAVVQGSVADWQEQAVNTDGTIPVFASGDTVTTYLYQGQTEIKLATLATVWLPPTGYATAQVVISPTSAQTAPLDYAANYTLQVWWTSADTTRTAAIIRRMVNVLAGPGATTQLVTPYCQLPDLMLYGPWIETVQNTDTDQEGFYTQRLMARQWMDWAIINCYRGAFVGLFEMHSYAAFAFGYAGWRRSLGPSPSLINYLAANNLLIRPQITRACAFKAISEIGLAQIGINNQLAALGSMFADRATAEICATTAEVDINGDGIGELFINLGATNTLQT